jgi:hypothetical protein
LLGGRARGLGDRGCRTALSHSGSCRSFAAALRQCLIADDLGRAGLTLAAVGGALGRAEAVAGHDAAILGCDRRTGSSGAVEDVRAQAIGASGRHGDAHAEGRELRASGRDGAPAARKRRTGRLSRRPAAREQGRERVADSRERPAQPGCQLARALHQR